MFCRCVCRGTACICETRDSHVSSTESMEHLRPQPIACKWHYFSIVVLKPFKCNIPESGRWKFRYYFIKNLWTHDSKHTVGTWWDDGVMLQVKRMAHYQTDMTPQTGASLLAHLAPFVSCSFSGCQTSSWNAVGDGFKAKSDRDHPHYVKDSEMAQNRVQSENDSICLMRIVVQK